MNNDRSWFAIKAVVACMFMLSTAVLSAGEQRVADSRLILDMVHHNPGEPLCESAFESPAFTKDFGFDGKVYFLFDSPTLAIDWESVDPEIFPKGSAGRAWVDKKAARIDAQHAACKAAGLKIFAMADLVLFPKSLVKKYNMQKTFGDPRDPQTDKFLRAMVAQMFDRFPGLDGLVVRIGETYLHDAPFHQGTIQNVRSPDATIIPLMKLLREEVCAKRNKQLVFRTWLSFDNDSKAYLAVSDAVEPHPNLLIGVKHCEKDFHRGNPFSKVVGIGRHRQIIEVQCQREYEGKGAYPNYIANGVIEGFEEHRLQMPPDKLKSIREFSNNKELYGGVWTWSRGGGWKGPFIKNELWCELNTWVMAQWAKAPSQSEEQVFNRFATERLKLQSDDVVKFRRLCLLSADAVLRGKSTTRSDVSPWWSRDDGINWPSLPVDEVKRKRILEERAEAVRMWEEIVGLAQAIRFPDSKTGEFVSVSSKYGLNLYRIYQAVFELAALGTNGDREKINKWLAVYDQAWADFRKLPSESPQCATLYAEKGAPVGRNGTGIEKMIPAFRIAEPKESAGVDKKMTAGSADELDLGAMVQPVPREAKFAEPGYFVWCGAPIKGADSKYHLYYSRWPVEKGFAPGWALWSEIAYAVADKPLGPYKHVNVALPARGREFWDGTTTHNPNILQKDGKYYLFYMGNTGDGKSYPMHRNNQRIGVAVADKPEGPWKRFDKPIVDVSADKKAFDSLCVTNPGATERPDGGILLIYKAVEYVEGKPMGGKVRYGAALADKPEGPYVKKPGRIFEAEEADAGKHWMLAEDPFIWFSKRYGNRYYAVARDVVGNFTGSSGGIALFQSDDGLHWKAASHPKVITNRYKWADGSFSITNLERPALLFDGETPVALFGAVEGYKKGGRISSNVHIPLKP